jgi:hypothetical protein
LTAFLRTQEAQRRSPGKNLAWMNYPSGRLLFRSKDFRSLLEDSFEAPVREYLSGGKRGLLVFPCGGLMCARGYGAQDGLKWEKKAISQTLDVCQRYEIRDRRWLCTHDFIVITANRAVLRIHNCACDGDRRISSRALA